MRKLTILLAVALVAMAALSASAANVAGELGILDVSGTNPATGDAWAIGDQYRLAFISSTTTDATSDDIATYNAFVQGVATTAGLGGTWNIIGSTLTVDARDNTGTNPDNGIGVPIFLMDGITVFTLNNDELWGGGIDAFLNLDENGAILDDDRIFTGSFTDGTSVGDTLGGDTALGVVDVNPGDYLGVQTGKQPRTSASWIRNFKMPATDFRPVYAMSELLTITSGSSAGIVYPADGDDTIAPDATLTLEWINPDPNDPGAGVYVDVLFGTEPNALHPDYDMDWEIFNIEDANTVDVDASDEDTYYWRVDITIGDANTVEGALWSFTTVLDVAPTVEIDPPITMTWLGEGVQLNATVYDDEGSQLTIEWTADPPHGVSFDDDSIPNPFVTFTNRILIREIQDALDDGEEFINSMASGATEVQGTMTLGSSDLELGSEGNGGLDWQVIAVQYADLGIPQGSIITSAKITFTVDDPGAVGESNDFSILAEATDDAAAFVGESNNISDRDRTTESVAWAPDWGTGPVVGTKMETPDITTLIQEVVDREGWSADNRLTLMIYPDVYLASPTGGTTTVQEIEFAANPGSDSATLNVTYEPPAGSPPLSGLSTFTITVAVSDEANPTPNTASIEIDVYNDACDMTINGENTPIALTDLNADCTTDLGDLAIMTAAWLDDYASTVPK